MEESKKAMVLFALETLRKVNIECGISMAIDKKNDALWFFETDTYVQTGKFKGFSVPVEDLVNPQPTEH